MRTKRESLQVIHDILQSVHDSNGTIRPTRIMYKANLSHQMLKDYLKELLEKGFLEEVIIKKILSYRLTQKGYDYLHEFETIQKFMKSFGLDEDSSDSFDNR